MSDIKIMIQEVLPNGAPHPNGVTSYELLDASDLHNPFLLGKVINEVAEPLLAVQRQREIIEGEVIVSYHEVALKEITR